MMKLGFCAPVARIGEVAAAGFDYLEPPANALAALSDEEFESMKQTAMAASIPTPAFNLLFPKTLHLLEDATDEQIVQYLHATFQRMQALGGHTVVFGSGKSRNRPEDMGYGEAFRELTRLTRLTGEIAAQYGVTVVLEPLNRAETNMLCSMAEAAALVAMVDHPNVKLLSDSFHVMKENEPVSDIVRLGGVAHAHVATKDGRRYPLCEDEEMKAFFHCLKETGYQGNVSIEGKTDDMAADAPKAIKLLKTYWEEA